MEKVGGRVLQELRGEVHKFMLQNKKILYTGTRESDNVLAILYLSDWWEIGEVFRGIRRWLLPLHCTLGPYFFATKNLQAQCMERESHRCRVAGNTV